MLHSVRCTIANYDKRVFLCYLTMHSNICILPRQYVFKKRRNFHLLCPDMFYTYWTTTLFWALYSINVLGLQRWLRKFSCYKEFTVNGIFISLSGKWDRQKSICLNQETKVQNNWDPLHKITSAVLVQILYIPGKILALLRFWEIISKPLDL